MSQKYPETFYFLKDFLTQNSWVYDYNTPEKARAFFTTMCYMNHIEPDTTIADNMLLELYNDCDLESADVEYEEFDSFMCELIC